LQGTSVIQNTNLTGDTADARIRKRDEKRLKPVFFRTAISIQENRVLTLRMFDPTLRDLSGFAPIP